MMEKACLVEGCNGYPMHGYQASSKLPVKWACSEHKHLLQQEAPEPKAIVREETLFSVKEDQ